MNKVDMWKDRLKAICLPFFKIVFIIFLLMSSNITYTYSMVVNTKQSWMFLRNVVHWIFLYCHSIRKYLNKPNVYKPSMTTVLSCSFSSISLACCFLSTIMACVVAKRQFPKSITFSLRLPYLWRAVLHAQSNKMQCLGAWYTCL